jgi:hypothetical protein
MNWQKAMSTKAAKAKKKQAEPGAGELWVAPRYSLKGPNGEHSYENPPGGVPTTNRFLELADIALGLKKTAQKKKKTGPTHGAAKKEPYSR